MFKTLLLFFTSFGIATSSFAQGFSMEAVSSYPFVTELSAAAGSSKVAFTVNEKGIRNIYVAEGPAFTVHKLTNYTNDDGQEISSVTVSNDGKWVVYVLGGDHGAYDESIPRNPSSSTNEPHVRLYCIPFEGGAPIAITDGDYPVMSPGSNQVAFLKNSQVWVSSLSKTPSAKRLFFAKGSINSIQWSTVVCSLQN
jgi:Tol biopolymer transport system component